MTSETTFIPTLKGIAENAAAKERKTRIKPVVLKPMVHIFLADYWDYSIFTHTGDTGYKCLMLNIGNQSVVIPHNHIADFDVKIDGSSIFICITLDRNKL